MKDVLAVPCLKDNYAYLVPMAGGGIVVVDPSEGEPCLEAIARSGKRLVAVWATHHHHDHVGGIEAIVQVHRVPVFGSKADEGRIPGQTHTLTDGETFLVDGSNVRIKHVPGHTRGALVYGVDLPSGPAAFTGDTLFAAGCGRLFEGTAEQMHESLERIAGMDLETKLYPGHEYTVGNLKFALAAEPSNEALAQRMDETQSLRAGGHPTVPTTVAMERRTNPFLRHASPEIRAFVQASPQDTAIEVFRRLRARKDTF